MDQSLSLLSAQIHFLDTSLALIHIPLDLYINFVQPIIQLLLPAQSSKPSSVAEPSTGATNVKSRRLWASSHPFVNISVTPIECSIACPATLARELFVAVCDGLPEEAKDRVSISSEEYVVMQIDGEGLDAGQRVVELTNPLAMNGISIFFITTYFSDYILVPVSSRATVIEALESGGFVFSDQTEAFVNISSPTLGPSSMTLHTANTSADSASYFPTSPTQASFDDSGTPRVTTPTPSSIEELQTRTFATLKRHQVVPQVDPSIQLVQCAGRKDTLRGGEGTHASSVISTLLLRLGIIKSLTAVPRPRFLSLTLTDSEPASILLEQGLLVNFADDTFGTTVTEGEDVLLGNKEDVLVPITLDLRGLPIESTGIVCGVAGRLVGATASQSNAPMLEDGDNRRLSWGEVVKGVGGPPVEMSYLSTARAGTVIVAETELERALEALRREVGRQDEAADITEGDEMGSKEDSEVIVEHSASIPMALPRS